MRIFVQYARGGWLCPLFFFGVDTTSCVIPAPNTVITQGTAAIKFVITLWQHCVFQHIIEHTKRGNIPMLCEHIEHIEYMEYCIYCLWNYRSVSCILKHGNDMYLYWYPSTSSAIIAVYINIATIWRRSCGQSNRQALFFFFWLQMSMQHWIVNNHNRLVEVDLQNWSHTAFLEQIRNYVVTSKHLSVARTWK